MAFIDDAKDLITLQRLDSAAGVWVNLAEDPIIPAAVRTAGSERYEFVIRYRTDLVGFKETAPAMRVLYGDRTLDIADVSETDRRRFVTITATGRQIETDELATGARRTQAWPNP